MRAGGWFVKAGAVEDRAGSTFLESRIAANISQFRDLFGRAGLPPKAAERFSGLRGY